MSGNIIMEKNSCVKTQAAEKSILMKIKSLVIQSSRVIVLLILMIVLSILSPNFLSWTNLINVLRQSVPQLLISLGMTVVLLTGGIDLSLGSITTLTCAVTAYSMKMMQMHWIPSIVIGLSVGLLMGLINGMLITKGRLPAPVATYGMLWVGSGLAFAVMGAFPIFGFADNFRFIGTGYLGGIPVQVIIAGILIVVFVLFLRYTILGRDIYAVGSNYRASKASGIKVNSVLILAYMISGLMASVAGVILLSRLNAVDQNAGANYLLPAIAGPVMGGTSMKGGEGGVWGAVIGSLILIIITNGMNLLKVSSLWQQLIIGLVVILAVWLDSVLRKRIELQSI